MELCHADDFGAGGSFGPKRGVAERPGSMTVAGRNRGAAAEAAELLTRLGLVVLLVVLPVAGSLSRGAIYALLPVGGVSILCGAVLGAPTHGTRRLREALLSPLGAAALLLAVWTGLSLLWTPFPAVAGERYFKMIAPAALAALVAAYLPEKTRALDLYLLPFGVAATAVAALGLVFFGPAASLQAGEFDETLLDRTMITLLVLVWPALGAMALREHWIFAAALAILVAGVALVDPARVALAAMGAGAFVFAVAMSAPRRMAQGLAVCGAGMVLLAPLLAVVVAIACDAVGEVPASIAAWRDIVVAQGPRLVTGHGLELATLGRMFGFVPAQAPQSLLFLLWFDLGAPGAVGFACLIALAFTAAGQIPSLLGPALLAGLTAVLVLAFLGIAVGQIWWLTLLDCGAIGFALVGKAVQRAHRPDATEIAAGLAAKNSDKEPSPSPQD